MDEYPHVPEEQILLRDIEGQFGPIIQKPDPHPALVWLVWITLAALSWAVIFALVALGLWVLR